MKKNSADSPRPTTPRRAMPALRSPFNQTVMASQRNATRLKMESASRQVRKKLSGCSRVDSPISFLFIESNPFPPAILHQRYAVFIPHNHAVERIDQGSARARHFIINGSITQTPGGIDAPVGATDGTLVVQIETRGDLFIGHTLRNQLRHAQLIRLQQCAR